ncbi:hypothetical protein Q5752_000460 [Cryptotrichosporon argae]
MSSPYNAFAPYPLPRPPQRHPVPASYSYPTVPPAPAVPLAYPHHAPPPYPSCAVYGATTQHVETDRRSEAYADHARAGPSNAQVREWMRSLGTDMSGLNLGRDNPPKDKPLPPLPPKPYGVPSPAMQPIPHARPTVPLDLPHRPPSPPRHRPVSLPGPASEPPALPPPSTRSQTTLPVSLPSTPPQSRRFAPSFHPSRPRPLHEALLEPPALPTLHPGQSKSDSALPRPRASGTPGKSPPIIDLTADSDAESSAVSSCSSSSSSRAHVTPRTPARDRRAASESATPSTSARRRTTPIQRPKQSRPRALPSSSPASPCGLADRCAGFTRTGQPCKRLVRAIAPGLALIDYDKHRRYCKDHAGLVCQAEGFYWRAHKGSEGVWIAFKDYVPLDLGQQTQTVLRVTMESALTGKDQPGFLYVYELRDLGNERTAFFKVGRTDNVPRRIGQWTKQCTSHTPTLRDVFPLRAPARPLARQPSVSTSLLPGAVSAGTTARRMAPYAKRWERLVHLELADRASAADPAAVRRLGAPCADCGKGHREIFPVCRDGGYQLVVCVVERWERYVRTISQEAAA